MSDDRPVVLEAVRSKPDEAVIDALRSWLADARSGELSGAVLLGVYSDGTRRQIAGEISRKDMSHLALICIGDAIRQELDDEETVRNTDPDDDGES